VIRGPDTRLADSGGAIAVDPVHNLVIVFDSRGDTAGGLIKGRNIPTIRSQEKFGALLTFDRAGSGNVKPRSVIEGQKPGLVRVNQIQVYPDKGWILVSLRPLGDNYFAGVWSINDNGDVAPRWVLGNLPPGYRPGRTVAFDPDHKEVFGTAYGAGEAAVILRYSFPELF
jgi:hypothetical protein